MAVEIVADSRGRRWAVDWSVAASIVRSNLHWKLAIEKGQFTPPQTWAEWLQDPGGWGEPTVVNFDVPWDAVEREKKQKARSMIEQLHHEAERDPKLVRKRLTRAVRASDAKEKEWREKRSQASKRTREHIEAAVDQAETGKRVAEFVRDSSANILLTGATVASGGTAVAAWGAGAGMTFTANYQDSGNIGEATMRTTGTLVLEAVPVGKMVGGTALDDALRGKGEEAVMLVAGAVQEAGASWVSGDTVGTALEKGAITFASGGAAEVLSPKVTKVFMKRMGMPAKLRMTGSGFDEAIGRRVETVQLASQLPSSMVSKGAAYSLEKLSGPARKKARKQMCGASDGRRGCSGGDELLTRPRIVDHAIEPISSRPR